MQSGNNFAITLGATPHAGDTLILNYEGSVTNYGTVWYISETGVTWSGGGTGKQVGLDDASNGMDVEIWLGTVGPGASTAITIYMSAYGNLNEPPIADVCEYSGLASASTVLDLTATSPTGVASTKTTTTGTTATTTQANELWIGATIAWLRSSSTSYVTQTSSGSSSPTNGFTLMDGIDVYGSSGSSPAHSSLAMLEKIVSSTGTAQSGTTVANPAYADGVIATFKAAVTTTTQPTTTTTSSSTSTLTTSISATSTSPSSTTTITSSSTTIATTSPTQAATNNQPCSYQIFTNGTTTYAQNCGTGSIDYSGTAATTVINDAIAALTSGGKIFIKAGVYTLTTTPINLAGTEGAGNDATIGGIGISNIELYGEGNSTVLIAGPNLSVSTPQIIGVLNGNNWYIHDLQISGNMQQQSGAQYGMGIALWNSNNSTIAHNYVHDNKNVGIDTENSISTHILNNYIKNSGSNGIQVTGGSDTLIQGNTVDGSSDVGISISGNNAASGSAPISYVICSQNIIFHPTLGISAYGSNAGWGIGVGDNGYAENVTVSDNQISGATIGVMVNAAFGTDSNIIVSGNQIDGTTSTTEGILGESTIRLLITNNILTNMRGANQAAAILTASTCTNLSILNNQISGTPSAGIETETPNSLVQGNYVQGAGTGIDVYGEYSNIIGNTLYMVTYDPIQLEPEANYTLVEGNNAYWSSGEASLYVFSGYNSILNNEFYNPNNIGVYLRSGSEYNIVEGNDLRHTYSSQKIDDYGIRDTLENNAGYNPLGHIASPFVASGSYILDSGGSTTPASGTTYTNWESPKVLYVSGGTLTAIVVDGQTLFTAPTTCTIPLQPGETFSVTYTVAPTIVVMGE
jgi:parallel beta-helix repeat protein